MLIPKFNEFFFKRRSFWRKTKRDYIFDVDLTDNNLSNSKKRFLLKIFISIFASAMEKDYYKSIDHAFGKISRRLREKKWKLRLYRGGISTTPPRIYKIVITFFAIRY